MNKCGNFMDFMTVLFVMMQMLANGANSGLHSTCGQQGRCVPSYECSTSYEGSCQNLWCCKQSKYDVLPPQAGECICVSNTIYCGNGSAPYVFLIPDMECVYCECQNTCVALLENKLCPTYEAPVGDCEYGKSNYCCKTSTSDGGVSQKQCKCTKRCPVCPKSWKKAGECKLCCLP